MSRRAERDAGPASLRAELVDRLAQVRGLDRAGALAAIDGDAELRALLGRWPGTDPEELRQAMLERVGQLGRLAACLRCGTCCRVSSPTLYQEDLALIIAGKLARGVLYSLRAGEMAHSARLGRSAPLQRDLVKLRESPTGGCLLLRGPLCGAYDARPLQCRHLQCWSNHNAGDLQDLPRLGRRELFADDPMALALIEEFELKVPAAELTRLLTLAAAGDPEAAGQALELLELDHRLRAGISQTHGYPPEELELLLGRSGLQVAGAHGLEVSLDRAGRPLLRPKKPALGAI